MRTGRYGANLDMSVCIGTYNAKGLMCAKKRKRVSLMCKKYKLDVLCIQETHGKREECEKKWTKELGFELGTFSTAKQHTTKGAAIIGKGLENTLTDKEGRIAGATVMLGDYKVNIVSVYAPNLNQGRESQENYVNFLIELEAFIDKLMGTESNSRLMVCGDFNMIMDEHLDGHGDLKHSKYPIPIDMLEEMIGRLGLVDAYRWKHPNKKEYVIIYHKPLSSGCKRLLKCRPL